MTTLRDLAAAASMMPWDKTPADIPFGCRKAFRDAITPEIFLEMLEALQMAKHIVANDGTYEQAQQIFAAIAATGATP